MTAAPRGAASQSSRASRFPRNTSMCRAWPSPPAVDGLPIATESKDNSVLRGLAKQRKLRNPRSVKLLTSLDPMKPFAPVIRMRSSLPIMKSVPSSATFLSSPILLMTAADRWPCFHLSCLFRDVRYLDGSDAQACKQPPCVVTEANHHPHEPVMSQHQGKRQGKRISRHCDHGLQNIFCAKSRVERGGPSP